MRLTHAVVCCALVSPLWLSAHAVEAGSYHFSAEPVFAWKADPYQWITDKDAELGVRANLLLVRMAQNEWEHTAFALTNNTDSARSLRVDVRGGGIPDGVFQLRKVVMFEGARKGVSWLGWADNEPWAKPELLEDIDGVLELKPHSTAHIWITVHSRGMSSGEHRAWVRIVNAGDGGEVLRIPLKIEVWPFRLPETSGLVLSNRATVPGPPPLAEDVARLLAEHHVNVARFEVPPLRNGELDADRNDWRLRLKIARTWGIRPSLDAEHEDVTIDRIARLEPALFELGIRDWYIYVSNERSWEKFPGLWDRFKEIRRVAPSAKMYHSLWFDTRWDKAGPGLAGLKEYVDLWYLFRHYCLSDVFHGTRWKDWPKEMCDLLVEQQNEGKQVIFYQNTRRACNYRGASLAWERCNGWYVWEYGFDGRASWTDDSVPHADVANEQGQDRIFQLPPERQSISTYYYVRRLGDDRYRVLSCKRLEAWRDGIQDYLYLLILDDLLDQAEGTGKPELQALAKQGRATVNDAIEEIRLHIDESYAYGSAKRRCALEIIKLMEAGLTPRTNPDGTIKRHRRYRPERIYTPEDGGIPHPYSG